MKEIIYILISLIKLLQSQKQGNLYNTFNTNLESYSIILGFYEIEKNTSDDQNLYFFSYNDNSSKFLYYVINKFSKEIEFIGDKLTVPSIFNDSKFISVSFYKNSSYIYYLIEKNNSKYIGVYSILSHILICNKKVDPKTTFVNNIPNEKEPHILYYNNGTSNESFCPFQKDKSIKCKIPYKLDIDRKGNSKILTGKCDPKKYIYKVSNLTYCINDCPMGYKKKGNECILQCGDGKYHLNLRNCVSRCDESEIRINKNFCVSCEQSNKLTGINYEMCVDNCEEIYNVSYIENNQCLLKCRIGSVLNSTDCINCKEQNLFLNESIMKCVEKCENDIYDEFNICFNCRDRGLIYYEKTINNKTEKGCVKNCSDKNLEYDSNEKKCIQCEENYLYDKEEKRCIPKSNCRKHKNNEVCEKCLDFTNNNIQCIDYGKDITYCNIGSSIDINQKKCNNCSTYYFLYSNNSCVESCDLYNVKQDNICLDCINEDINKFFQNFTCVEKCADEQFISNYICHNCSSNGRKYYQGKCLEKCPDYTKEKESLCRTCPQINSHYPYYNIFNNSCIHNCDTFQVKNKKNDIDVCVNCSLIFNDSCYNETECPSYTFKKGIRCEICDNNKYFLNDKCIDKCIEGYEDKIDKNNIKYCKNCLYYLDYKCVDSCEKNNSFPYTNIISRHNSTICQKCVCNENGGICQRKNSNFDQSDYFCNCKKNVLGDFCHIYHENKTKDFYIYLYTKFPPSNKNRVGFKYKYYGKEKIKNITWGFEKNCESKKVTTEEENINGINEDIFILNGILLYEYSCNSTIFANLTLNDGNILKDELVINNLIIDINKYVDYNYSINDDSYCPLKNNISLNIDLKYWNSSYNFSFQLLYERQNSKDNDYILFEFTKEFYYNQLINNFISPGIYFALKIKSRDGNYMIKKNYKTIKVQDNCYNINDVFNKNDNSFIIVSKLLYLFDKNEKLNLTINHLNDIQEFLIKIFNEKLKEEEMENINSEKYNETYYKENFIYKSGGDNLYILKSNSIQLLIKLILNYLYNFEPNHFEKGVEILSNTTKILFNYKLAHFNIYNSSNYLCTIYYDFMTKMFSENKIVNNRNKIFNILFSDLQKLTSIISHSMIVGEMFESSNKDIIFQIEKLGKSQKVIAINNYIAKQKKKIIDNCEDINYNIMLCIENKELSNIINEINQFEKVNKTNISVSLITINNIKYLKNFVNSTDIELKNVISTHFKIINLLSDNLYNPYIAKKNYFYKIQFRGNQKYIKKNTFCAPINYLDKYDKENYCKTYFKRIKEIKEEVIICECNIFTQIGVFQNEKLAEFYKNIQFDIKKYDKLLSHIILITSLAMLSFFSIILLCYDIKEEQNIEKLKKMKEIEKVKYYYDKVSYLYKQNVISFSWYLFYFYSPLCQIFNIYSFQFPRHTRFMIELIKILLTFIISILKYRKGDISALNDFMNQRNYDQKKQSIHFIIFNRQTTIEITLTFIFIFFIYFIISIIFDYIYKFLENENIYEGKWKQMKTLITNFTYNQVKFESLFDEKWKKIRIKIFALSKICGESILKGLNREDKFTKYLKQQKDVKYIPMNDTYSNTYSINSNLKDPLLEKSENIIDYNSQINIHQKDKSHEKLKKIFQKYNKIQKNKKKENNDNNNLNDNENLDFKKLNQNSCNLFWNLFTNIILIFFILFFEIILKMLVDEISGLYGFNLFLIWYIPTIIIIIFYNFVINYLVCILISFIFFKSYYRTPSKIKKWFINKLIRNYRYFYKIMILISKNKTDIDFTINNNIENNSI